MKVYLVIERENEEIFDDNVYGVFTDKEKATQIMEDLLANFEEFGESTHITVMELNLDEVTEDYEFYMNS